jgi:hypothetical protein
MDGSRNVGVNIRGGKRADSLRTSLGRPLVRVRLWVGPFVPAGVESQDRPIVSQPARLELAQRHCRQKAHQLSFDYDSKIDPSTGLWKRPPTEAAL